MALTITSKKQGVSGDLRLVVADITETSYPTGGSVVTAATLGLKGGTIQAVIPNNTTAGYVAAFDHTNGKLMAFRQTAATGALVEAPNTTNIGSCRIIALVSGV
jgi:hypothetical protein